MRTIAIMNNKGGVGKTVTAINFADILVRDHKKRVVLADCDGQMNLTRFFLPGFDPLVNLTTAQVLTGDGEQVWSENLVDLRPDLWLLPGSPELYQLDLRAIKDGVSNPGAMRDFCEAAREDGETDFFLFDCPPGFTAASVAALMAADEVILPMTLDGFSFSGMTDMLMQIGNLREAKLGIKIAGVLITQWHNSAVIREAEELLRSLKIPVFTQTIRRTDKVPESTFARLPIATHSPTSAAAQDYRAWVREYLGQEVRHG